MTERKNAEGLNFLLLKLNPAANDKNKLVDLAHEALRESHTKRTFVERCGKDLNLLSLGLGATVGRLHAMTNKEFTTNDKLYLIIKQYVDLTQKNNPRISEKRAVDNFCDELKKRCPQEYGIGTKNKTEFKHPINLIMKSAQSQSIV